MDLSYGSGEFTPQQKHRVPLVTRQVIVYVSGPMPGYEGLNYKEFERVSNILESRGYKVVCPAQEELLKKEYTYDWCMRNSLDMLLECNAIYMLDGWQKSKGAQLEHQVASGLGMLVLNTSTGQL